MKKITKRNYLQLMKKTVRPVLCSLLITLTGFHLAYSQPGSLDASFDGDGIVTTPIGNTYEGVYAVMIQTDGKIVAAGYSNSGTISSFNQDFAVVRYNTDGSLDNTFDGDGKVITDFGSITDYATGALLQPDGKIVVCGRTYINGNYNYGCAVARYNPDGSLDNTFDGDGKVTYDIGPMDDIMLECAIQPDGKILVAGYSYLGSQGVFAVLRFNTSGSLDNTFGAGGLSTVTFGTLNARCIDVTVLSGGKILTLGRVGSSTDDFALAQLSGNGQLDNTFGVGGKVTTDFAGADDFGETIAVQPDGKIIAAGFTGDILTVTEFAMIRYTPSGNIDSTFGINGKVTTALASTDEAYAIALQPDSKILLAGKAYGSDTDFGIARYNNNGTLDLSFDTDGKVIIPITGNNDPAFAIALQADGKIVVAGRADFANDDFALIRLNGDMITGSGIDMDLKSNDEVYLFPNPADDQVTVNNIKPSGRTIIKIYDASGRVVHVASLTGKIQHQLNIENLDQGVFICEVTSESGKQTLPFTKLK